MIRKSIDEGHFDEEITGGLFSLIPKGGENKDLNYWRPITLLTTIYKILAKLLQQRLQPILINVISPEQTAFLPLRSILGFDWLEWYNWKWAEEGDLSKLLWTPFGLNILTHTWIIFFTPKLPRNLTTGAPWNSQWQGELLYVAMSFFPHYGSLSLYGGCGSNKIIRKIRSVIRNYL